MKEDLKKNGEKIFRISDVEAYTLRKKKFRTSTG